MFFIARLNYATNAWLFSIHLNPDASLTNTGHLDD